MHHSMKLSTSRSVSNQSHYATSTTNSTSTRKPRQSRLTVPGRSQRLAHDRGQRGYQEQVPWLRYGPSQTLHHRARGMDVTAQPRRGAAH